MMARGINKFFVPCVRKRPVWDDTSTGRPKITSYQDTPINGYIGSQTDITGYTAGKFTVKTQYNFYCDDFNIKMGDFLVYENNTYEIAGEPKNTAHKDNHIRIMVEKTKEIKQY
jgi:hypothetical protein